MQIHIQIRLIDVESKLRDTKGERVWGRVNQDYEINRYKLSYIR